MGRNTGLILVAAGLALLVLTVTASAALAPDPTVPTTDDDPTLVGSQGISSDGDVRLLTGSSTRWVHDGAPSYFEVEQLDENTVIAAFALEAADECGALNPPCGRTGYRVIETAGTPTVVSEWSFPIRTAENSELHAVEPLDDGSIAVADMEHERVAVVDEGRVTWQWNASSFYEAPPDPTRTDWLHINDVDAIGDGRLLVSVRNANQLLVLQRGGGVLEVINTDRGATSEATCRRNGELVDTDGDGDVRCGDPALFSHQHNPHWLGNGAVLVADSENDRIVELHKDMNGRWRPIWQLTSAGGIDFYWPRDADRLPNGHTLITDSLNKRVLEVAENGTMVWSAIVPSAPYEADRLPTGEALGVPHVRADGSVGLPVQTEIPVVSTVVLGLHSIFPWLPFWVGELQVVLTMVGLGVTLGGFGIWLRTR